MTTFNKVRKLFSRTRETGKEITVIKVSKILSLEGENIGFNVKSAFNYLLNQIRNIMTLKTNMNRSKVGPLFLLTRKTKKS